MPVIADTSQDAALRLQRAIVEKPVAPDKSKIVVTTGWPVAAGFLVSDELLAAYEADLVAHVAAPTAASCQSSPCYTAQCTPPVAADPNEHEFEVTYSAHVTVDGFHVIVAIEDGPPNADYTFDWGDGTTEPLPLDDDGNWTGSHTYDEAGTFVLAVSDDDSVVASLPVPVPST